MELRTYVVPWFVIISDSLKECFVFLKKLFIWEAETEIETDGQWDRRRYFHPMGHFPSAYNTLVWAGLKLGVRNSIQVSLVGVRNSINWVLTGSQWSVSVGSWNQEKELGARLRESNVGGRNPDWRLHHWPNACQLRSVQSVVTDSFTGAEVSSRRNVRRNA